MKNWEWGRSINKPINQIKLINCFLFRYLFVCLFVFVLFLIFFFFRLLIILLLIYSYYRSVSLKNYFKIKYKTNHNFVCVIIVVLGFFLRLPSKGRQRKNGVSNKNILWWRSSSRKCALAMAIAVSRDKSQELTE